jgi:hypothetical protein
MAKKKQRKFLYLIPFSSGDMFKIGFTNGRKRLRDHDKSFNIDFEKSILVFAKSNAIIRSLETQFLAEYADSIIKIKNKKDGYTEIRSIEVFEEIIAEIKEKQSRKPRLRLRFKKLTRLFVYPPRRIKSVNDESKPKKIVPAPYDYAAFTRAVLGGTRIGHEVIAFIKTNPNSNSLRLVGELDSEEAFITRWAPWLNITLDNRGWFKPIDARSYSPEEKIFDIHFTNDFTAAVLIGEIESWIRREGVPERIDLPPGELDHFEYFSLIEKTNALGIKLSWGLSSLFPFIVQQGEPWYHHLDKIGYKKVGRNEWAKEPVQVPPL